MTTRNERAEMCRNLAEELAISHHVEFLVDVADDLTKPIPMTLYCPACGTQHIDAPEDEIDMQCNTNLVPGVMWNNPPHRSHLCGGLRTCAPWG